MSISIQPYLDPAIECLLFLSRACAQEGDVAASIGAAERELAEKYGIPIQQLEELTAPLSRMEAELREVLLPRSDLWDCMFYPGSYHENNLAWGFFFLERQGGMARVDLSLRQRLTSLLLSCGTNEAARLDGLDALVRYLEDFKCSNRTKWLCTQVWAQPEGYYARYRELVELAATVVRRYSQQLQAQVDAATGYVVRALEHGPDAIWAELGIPLTPPEILTVYPMGNNFNGVGLRWDHTMPGDTAYLTIGLLRGPIAELIRRYSGNSELLSERLKVISDQRRLEILKALKEQPLCGQELAELLSLSPATISHHMNTLVSDGFVSFTRQGAKTLYSLHRQNLDSFLQSLRNTLL